MNATILSIVMAVALLAPTIPVKGSDNVPQSVPPKISVALARQALPADNPGAASEYSARKRRTPAGGPEAAALLRRASTQRAAMRVHSTRLGGILPDADAFVSPLATAPLEAAKTVGVWESLGPGNIGGRTRTLIIQPDNPDIMYLGGVSGGIWKTTNGGQHWSPIADQLANIAVNAMVMDPERPETLYAGTGEGFFREEVRGTWLPLRGQGIFKTTDGGRRWTQLEATLSSDFHWVNDLVISPHDHERVYAATRSGVWRSDDGGEHWTLLRSDHAKGGCLDLALRSDRQRDVLFASCGTLDQGTVYRNQDASDNGAWETVLEADGMGRTSLAIAPSDQNVIYALSAQNRGYFDMGLNAVYRSQQGGDAGSWEVRVDRYDPRKINTLLLTNPAAASYLDCGWDTSNSWVHMGWYCNTIAVDPTDPNRVWAGGVDLFRSDDGGRNWGLGSYWWVDQGHSKYTHADQHNIVFHPDYDGINNQILFTVGDGGIFRSINSRAAVATQDQGICDPDRSMVQWTTLNHNLGITQFYHGLPYPGGDRFLGGTQDNGTILSYEEFGPDGWFPIFGGDGGYVAIDPQDPRTIYVEYQWSRFQKSTNGGLTFRDARTGIQDSPYGFLFITPFVMDPANSQVLWTGGIRMWRTSNGASSWTAASTRIDPNQSVSAIAIDPTNSNTVVAGTTNGKVYRTEQGLGATSSTIWTSSRPRDAYVSALAFDPFDTDVVWATLAEFGGPHVYRSRDAGTSWEAVVGVGRSALPDIPVHSIVPDPSRRGRIFVGTDLGVFVSLDHGASWSVENSGFANAVTEWLTLGVDADNRPMLYAFTHGRGAWRVPLDPPPPPPRRGTGRH